MRFVGGERRAESGCGDSADAHFAARGAGATRAVLDATGVFLGGGEQGDASGISKLSGCSSGPKSGRDSIARDTGVTLWCRFARKQFPACNLSYLITKLSEKIPAM